MVDGVGFVAGTFEMEFLESPVLAIRLTGAGGGLVRAPFNRRL